MNRSFSPIYSRVATDIMAILHVILHVNPFLLWGRTEINIWGCSSTDILFTISVLLINFATISDQITDKSCFRSDMNFVFTDEVCRVSNISHRRYAPGHPNICFSQSDVLDLPNCSNKFFSSRQKKTNFWQNVYLIANHGNNRSILLLC